MIGLVRYVFSLFTLLLGRFLRDAFRNVNLVNRTPYLLLTGLLVSSEGGLNL